MEEFPRLTPRSGWRLGMLWSREEVFPTPDEVEEDDFQVDVGDTIEYVEMEKVEGFSFLPCLVY